MGEDFRVSQEQLDAWAHACGRANYALLRAQEAQQSAHGGGDPDAVSQGLGMAAAAVGSLLQALVRAGAARPCHPPTASPAAEPALASAAGPNRGPAAHDTPAGRRLLSLLREAEDAAGEVDAERGWENGGWAEAIEKLAFPLSVEVYGRVGPGHSARTERPWS
jgi:hypothetical protein